MKPAQQPQHPDGRPARSPRADFPILERRMHGHPLAYLDNAGSTHKPQAVIDALVDFYTLHNANTHSGVHTLSEEATGLYEGARAQVASFLGAPTPGSIVFTAGTTQSINLVAESWAGAHIGPGDEIVLTALEHHSNLLPWQRVSQRTGARLRYVELDAHGALDAASLASALTPRTKLVAVTHVSNVLGTINPVQDLTRRAHDLGALVLVDAAQSVAHLPLNVVELDCDFLAFSGHKVFGPTGIGVLYAKPELLEAMPPHFSGGGAVLRVTDDTAEFREPPWRFEAGTPHIAGAVGLAAALRYLSALDRERLWREEQALTRYALGALGELPRVTLHGPTDAAGAGEEGARAGVIAFTVQGVHPHDVAQVLDGHGVAVRGGHHCCQPLMQRLGLQAVVRASLALYNAPSDIDQLVAGLREVDEIFNHG